MSVISIQVGQAGNQVLSFLPALLDREIGVDFLAALLEARADEPTLQRYFRPLSATKHTARAIAVDMEAKAVSGIIARTHNAKFTYAQDRVYVHRRGAGNNWANGYNSCSEACEEVMEMVQREVCEFLCTLSLRLTWQG